MSDAVILNNSFYASNVWNNIPTKGTIVAAAIGITAGIGGVIPSFTTAKYDCENLAEKVKDSSFFNTDSCLHFKNEFNKSITSWNDFKNNPQQKCSKLIFTASTCEEQAKDLIIQCSYSKYSCDYATQKFNEFLKKAESVDTFPEGICTQSNNEDYLDECEFRKAMIPYGDTFQTKLEYISHLKRLQQLWPNYEEVEKQCSKYKTSLYRKFCEGTGAATIVNCEIEVHPWSCQYYKKIYDSWINGRDDRQRFNWDTPPPKPSLESELKFAEEQLELKPGYSDKDFKRAFRNFSLKNHPDKFIDEKIKTEKEVIFKRVSAVFSDRFNPIT